MAEVNGTKPTPVVADVKAPEVTVTETNGFLKKPAVDISVALAANNLKSVSGLVNDISSLGTAASNGDEQARLDLVEKARSLVQALETPRETMIKHCWAQVRPFPLPMNLLPTIVTVFPSSTALRLHRLDRWYRHRTLHRPR